MIDHREVQSIVLLPHAAAEMELWFLRCASGEQLRDVLEQVEPLVTFAADFDPAATSYQLGITAAGLRKLGIGDRAEEALPRAFAGGMRRAAARLGDDECSGPEHWPEPFSTGDAPIDAVLVLRSASWKLGDDVRLGRAARRPVPDLVRTVRVGRWKGRHRCGYEPFGFLDGISDPVIDGSGRTVTPGNGVWDPERGDWRAVAPGEAVLGHVDERGVVAGHPAAAQLERDGSYLVIRRLAQHVQEFWDACAAVAQEISEKTGAQVDAEAVAAQLVGRTKDGAALGREDREQPDNGFRYRTGPDAAVHVPPTSHIRRSNPRDDIESADLMVRRHLLFRRGMPYGNPDRPRHGEHGLLFLAVCADIGRQFEFVQSHWLQSGNRFGLGPEPDALTGNRRTSTELDAGRDHLSAVRPDGRRSVHDGIAPFVTTTGGEYVLLPSRAALRRLVRPGRSS